MRRRNSRRSRRRLGSWPSTRIEPVVGASRPASSANSVDLPPVGSDEADHRGGRKCHVDFTQRGDAARPDACDTAHLRGGSPELTGADDGADMLAVQRRLDALGVPPVDDLEVVDQPGVVE